MLLFILCAIASMTAVSAAAQPKAQDAPAICTTPECHKIAELIIDSRNTSIQPCNDFYEYACGNYKDKSSAPGWPLAGTLDGHMLIDNARRMRDMLERLGNGTQTLQNPSDRDIAGKVVAFYQSCVASVVTKSPDLSPLRQFLDKVAEDLGDRNALDTLSSPSDSTAYNATQFMTALARVHSVGVEPFFKVQVQGEDGPGLTIEFWPLPSTSDGDGHTLNDQRAMEDLLRRLFPGTENMNWADPFDRGTRLQRQLQSIVVNADILGNAAWHNPRDPLSLQELDSPGLPLRTFLNTLLNITRTNVTLEQVPEYIWVADPSHIEAIGSKLIKAGGRTAKAYLILQAARTMASRFARQLSSNPAGGDQSPPRRRATCLYELDDAMTYAMHRLLYIDRFTLQDQAQLSTIASDVHLQLAKRVQASARDDSTETSAERSTKVASLRLNVGMAAQVSDAAKVAARYEGLYCNSTHYLENKIAMWAGKQRFMWNRLASQPDEYPLPSALTPHSAYTTLRNTVIVSQSAVQQPVFSPNQPQCLNYGGIGGILGHHMRLAVVVLRGGPQDTGNGYMRRYECLLQQYGEYYNIKRSQIAIGSSTILVMAADIAGLQVSWDAWQARRGNTSSVDAGTDARLPGLLEYSPEQLFFMSRAMVHCTAGVHMGDTALQLKPNERPNGPARLNSAVQSSQDFSTAFNCPVGSKMNPDREKCPVW
ncbi:Membrane metallo-endopeptidase-like 1 [Sorochytrium milnesiophthora]